MNHALGVKNTYATMNETHFWGIGDWFQIIGEEFGAITTPSVRAAEALREMNGNDVVAHSQGTSVVRGALNLISDDLKGGLNYQGFGGQSFLNSNLHGLNSARNVASPGDPVPMASPFKLIRQIGTSGWSLTGNSSSAWRHPGSAALSFLGLGSSMGIHFHAWGPNYENEVIKP